jgi:hypothetical protein
MSASSIIMIVVIIVLLYLVIVYLMRDISTLQKSVSPAVNAITISPPSSDNSNKSANFTYSIWFYVNDWNYRYVETKFIFARVGAGGGLSANAVDSASINSLSPCPAVTLDPQQNNLNISITCFGSGSTSGTAASQTQVNTSSIQNIPIQRWVNLLFSAYGRTLDLYIDGKLVRTSILPGIAKINPQSSIYLTPNGGFNGYTSKFQYWPNATDPQTAWNIYTEGYGGGFFGSLLGQYQVQFSFINNGQTVNSITI